MKEPRQSLIAAAPQYLYINGAYFFEFVCYLFVGLSVTRDCHDNRSLI